MALIEVRDLVVERAGRTIAALPELALEPEVPLVLLGPSGAGKTTILRAIMGLIEPSAGSITIDGTPLSRLSPRDRSAWFAWLPQLAAPQEPLAAVEYLLGARYRFSEPRAHSRAVLAEKLADCGVGSLAEHPVSRLSGGELQRVQLAGLLAQEARFLLLDEPANHLDPALVGWLQGLLAARIAARQGVLAVTHDLGLVTALERSTGRPVQLLGMAAGEARFQCPSSDPALPAHLEALYGIPWERLEHDGRRLLLPVGP